MLSVDPRWLGLRTSLAFEGRPRSSFLVLVLVVRARPRSIVNELFTGGVQRTRLSRVMLLHHQLLALATGTLGRMRVSKAV